MNNKFSSTNKAALIKFLETALQIIKEDGDDCFSDLCRKSKQQIFDAFMDIGLDYNFEGDCDGYCLWSHIGIITVRFFSSRVEIDYESDLRDSLTRLDISVDGYIDGDLSISSEQVIETIRSIPIAVPPVAILDTFFPSTDGTYTIHAITLDKAKDILAESEGIVSGIKRKKSTQALSALLGVDVRPVKENFNLSCGQQAIMVDLQTKDIKLMALQETESTL